MAFALLALETRIDTIWRNNRPSQQHNSRQKKCNRERQSTNSRSPSQAVLMLIIGYLCASSASLLQTEKVAPEDVSPAKFLPALTIGSTATSQGRFRTSLNTLTGYVTSVTYSDTSCKITLSVVVEILNSCIRTGKGTSQFVTATSSSVTRSRFSDSSCTSATKGTAESYTDGACVSSKKTSINPTYKFNAEFPTASMK